jgi:hypothetical protein
MDPFHIFELRDSYECEWKEGKKDGNGKLIFRNGDIFTGVWFSKKCKREGVLKDRNGNFIREGSFVDYD